MGFSVHRNQPDGISRDSSVKICFYVTFIIFEIIIVTNLDKHCSFWINVSISMFNANETLKYYFDFGSMIYL